MKASDFSPELEELDRRSTGKLQMAETFDRPAFVALKEHLCAIAEAAKSEHVLSKQVLGSLRAAAQAIRNQAPYIAGAQENLSMASEFEALLDLMIIGEGCDDRVSGVPRIV